MTQNQKRVQELKERIHEIKEYLMGSGCSACFDMMEKLKGYEDEIKNIEELSQKNL